MSADAERFRVQAEFCKAMAHPVRLQILDRLSRGSAPVNELAREIGVSQANLSQHLAVLRARGVVHARRQGNAVLYSLVDRRIVAACRMIREILAEQVHRAHSLVAGSAPAIST